MDKRAVVAAVMDLLSDQFESRQRSAKSTREGGNDPESRATSKYDTLAIEENYLADGLAKQVMEAHLAIQSIAKLPLSIWPDRAPVDVGALVELQFASGREWFLISPAAGGLEVEIFQTTITLITPESPLGSKLIGLLPGKSINNPEATVVAIC